MIWIIWFAAVALIIIFFAGAGKRNDMWDADNEELEKTLESHDEFGWHSAERRRDQMNSVPRTRE